MSRLSLCLAVAWGCGAALSHGTTRCLDPRSYGAVAGNPGGSPGPNWLRNTAAIQKAIDDAVLDPCSCVEILGGDFVTADVYLRSNMAFFISADARLLTAVNKTATSVIHVLNASNVTLKGGGVVYGNSEHYIAYYSPVDNRFEPTFPDGDRPHLLLVEGSQGVRIEDLRFLNSSDWNLQIKRSDDVIIDGVTIIGDQRFPNNDGIEPDSCTRLRIWNSYIDVADDGISPISTLKDGPMRDLHVRNVTIRSKSHAIKFGSTCEAECNDVVFENITIWDSNSGLAIQQRGRGDIHNVTFRNIHVETRYQAPRWWGNGEWLSITVEARHPKDMVGSVYDLRFENISAHSENGGLLSGLANDGIRDVTFSNVNVTIEPFANYSKGTGPPCCLPEGKANITCMGTQDHRPSFREDVSCTSFGNCRMPAVANGLYLENAHDVKVVNFEVHFIGERLNWYGDCLAQDSRTSGVSRSGAFKCVNGPASEYDMSSVTV